MALQCCTKFRFRVYLDWLALHLKVRSRIDQIFLEIVRSYVDKFYFYYYADESRQTRPNSGGVAEGQPRFDKGWVAIIFYFLRVKNVTF